MVGTCEHYVKWVVHVPTLLPFTVQKAIYLIRKAPLLSLWYFSLYHKTNIYTKRMRRLLSVRVNYISGERYISYKVTH